MRKGLELIVDEPLPGQFHWVVLGREIFGVVRRAVDRAPAPFATSREAMQAGILAMRSHMEPLPA